MRALGRHEKVDDAIQRIVQKSTRASVTLLAGVKGSTVTDQAIHDLRKRVKMLRSLLRLVRADMGRSRYRRANRCLREANRPLSDARDAKVAVTSCDQLMRRSQSLDTVRGHVHERLARRLEARVRVAASPGTRRIITGRLRTAERLVNDWHASQGTWKGISRGLRSMYVKGRDALRKAAADRSDASLHELRKRAKDLLYACELLRKAGPRARSLFTNLKRFTDLLGKHRDLALLQHMVISGGLVDEDAPREKLVKLTSRERASACNRALTLGLRIYHEPPAAFVTRMHRDWKTWRHS